jgi:hypothetical protein
MMAENIDHENNFHFSVMRFRTSSFGFSGEKMREE